LLSLHILTESRTAGIPVERPIQGTWISDDHKS
jgi:hypothetical protein